MAYEDALDLARTAAVQETLANQAASRHAYLQVCDVPRQHIRRRQAGSLLVCLTVVQTCMTLRH